MTIGAAQQAGEADDFDPAQDRADGLAGAAAHADREDEEMRRLAAQDPDLYRRLTT